MSLSLEQPLQPPFEAHADGHLSGGGIGFWDMERDREKHTALIRGDEVFARLFSLDPLSLDQGVGLDEILGRLRPEDRLAAHGMFSDPSYRSGPFDSRYGLQRTTGEMTWLAISRRPMDRGEQAGERLSGVVVDVTPQTAASQAMAGSELRFRALAEAVPQNVFSTDAEGVHDFLNRRWFEFTGEPIGPVSPERWLDFLHEGDRARTLAAWQVSLDEGAPYDVEYRYLRHDGQYRWMRVMALPERDAQGRITRWFGTATDIHDAKQMETERELISAELSHRIKNLFSVFGGLISLSSRMDEGAVEFADAMQKRLSALAIAHEFIGFSAVDGDDRHSCSLHALLGELALPYYEGEEAGELRIQGQDLVIAKGAVTPVTLVAHELLTNAVKYGALSQAGGVIQIDTHMDEASLYLDWRETWPELRQTGLKAEGFGSEMLTTVVERLLHGRIERSLVANRLEAALVLPLDKIT